MSAQMNQIGSYMPDRDPEFNSAPRKVSDVEQELAVLNKNAEAIALCVDELEKRLACVLPPSAPVATGNTSLPEVVRVPLAEMIRTPNNRLHSSLTKLNDIIARIELPS